MFVLRLLRPVLCALLVACLAAPSDAATRYVPSQYATIQAAINASVSGDTVQVAAGTYTGAGNVNLDFGGRNITLQGLSASSTVIDCQGINGQRGFYFHSGETIAAVVEDLTVAHGNITANAAPFGAGALVASGSPQFVRVTFSGNTVGGNSYGSDTPAGGGTEVTGGSPTFIACLFTGNSSSAFGGGASSEGGSVSFADCVFTGNQGHSGGGGAFIDFGSGSFTHCTFTGNDDGGFADGIEYDNGSGSVTNCILYGDGDEIENFISVSVTYSDVQGGTAGTGNINADPLFIGGGNFRLQSGSPAVGTGTASGGPATDADGRPFRSTPSMGAYELPTTRYVPEQYVTIQAAINSSYSGDTVSVAAGSYTGNGNTDLDFGGRNISLLGAGASSTVINCQGSSAAPHRGFFFQSGESNAALVQGFTVANGYENGSNGSGGGAVLISSSSPTFRACVFSNNQVNTPGGVSEGGAVALSFSGDSPVFTNCVFVGNQAVSSNQTRGGAFYAENNVDVTLTNCTFSGNSVSGSGGSDGNIGSALCDIASGALTITNCIFYGDTGSPYGEILVQNATETTTYSDIQGGRSGTGNFDADPLFLGSANLHLTALSPCIDAGTDSGAPTIDLDGNARDAEPDLGAYEFSGHARLTLTGQNNTAPAQQSFTGTVATLTDANPNAAASDFSATITWGDGTGTTAGTVSGASQPFAVSGTHTYAAPGQYTVTTTVTEKTVGTQKQTTGTFAVIGAPTANAQTVSVPFNTARAITLTGSDPNRPPRSLTYSIVTGPAHGTLSGTAPNLTYTPSVGYHGADSFQFTVSNGFVTSNTATVTLTVAPGTPTANPQSVSVPFGTATSITLTGSDPDSPPLALTYTVTANPTHGTLSGTAPNLTYTPNIGYVGPDSFSFTVSNGTNTSSPATVSISVSLAGTTTGLQSSVNPSVFGQSVQFTATVAVGGTPALTGSVDFVDTTTGTDLGTVAVNAATGQAQVSTSALGVGTHSITATYSDSSGVYGGSGDGTTQIVNKADTTTALTLPATTPDDTQTFQVSANVTANAPGAGTPGGTVTFTVNGVTQDVPLTNGTASITVGPFAPGTVTVSASYGGDGNFNSSSASQQSQNVTAGPATQFIVSAPATATAGTAISVSVTAQDAQGYTATGYTGTVHFTSTDGAATLPADVVLAAGTATVSVTLNTAGSQTVTVTDTTTASITGTSGSIVVGAAAATHFSVTAPGTATAGTAFDVTVTALDAQGNVATGYTGTVHFTSTDGAATLPTDATLTGGTGTFSIMLNTGGTQTVTATDTVTSSVTGTSGAIQATALNPVPTLTGITDMQGYTYSPKRTLQVNGTGFVPGSVVYGNGTTAMATTFVSSTELTATLPDSLLSTTGTVSITVQTPGPGGGTSNALVYTVRARIVSLTLSVSTVKGGTKLTGTIQLNQSVPAVGQRVVVTTTRPDLVGVPFKVFVAGGQSRVTFAITTQKVTSKVKVNITATQGGDRTKSLNLTP